MDELFVNTLFCSQVMQFVHGQLTVEGILPFPVWRINSSKIPEEIRRDEIKLDNDKSAIYEWTV